MNSELGQNNKKITYFLETSSKILRFLNFG